MATGGIGGVGSNYNYGFDYNTGFNSGNEYDSWVNDANNKADELKEQLGIKDKDKDTSSTSSTSNSYKPSGSNTVSSGAGYLRGYQSALEDLEDASYALRMDNEDNVFAKYEKALAAADKAAQDGNAEAIKKTQEDVEKAFGNIVSAIETFAKEYNNTLSFLKNNNGATATAAEDLAGFKRGVTTDKALQTIGLSKDKDGYLSVDEDKLKETLEQGYGLVKEVVGGQYGMADRVGRRATSILDSPVHKIRGTQCTKTQRDSKTSSSTSASKAASSKSGMSDSFSSFASFARSGAYNLTNYYAVGMLLNTMG